MGGWEGLTPCYRRVRVGLEKRCGGGGVEVRGNVIQRRETWVGGIYIATERSFRRL